MKRALFFISLFLLISCEKESPLPEALGENGGIVGTWVENVDVSQAVVDDGVTRLSRSDDLDEHSYGFTILEDGTFIERKNAGWCGTPPIFYDNFSGYLDSPVRQPVGNHCGLLGRDNELPDPDCLPG